MFAIRKVMDWFLTIDSKNFPERFPTLMAIPGALFGLVAVAGVFTKLLGAMVGAVTFYWLGKGLVGLWRFIQEGGA